MHRRSDATPKPSVADIRAATGGSTPSPCGRTRADPLARLALLFDGTGTRLGRPGVAHARRRRGRRPRRRFERIEALAPGVHPLARRQRRAGLPLGLGRRPARRAPGVDQPVLEERARAGRLRHRRVRRASAAASAPSRRSRSTSRAAARRSRRPPPGSSTATAPRPRSTARCAPPTGTRSPTA